MTKPAAEWGGLTACPTCGSTIGPHCVSKTCCWWSCANSTCKSFGYDGFMFVNGRTGRREDNR